MYSKSFSFVVVMLFCLLAPTASADDHPTARDLEVAYCDGVADAALDSAWAETSAFPDLHDALVKRRKHFLSYLMSRGYFDRKDIPSLISAITQGRADWQSTYAALGQCEKECPLRPVPTDQYQSSKAFDDMQACARACEERLTNGKSEKLRTCEEVEYSLTF